MLVFYAPRLVFLSVPKTGTTAWQNRLAPLADLTVTNPPEIKHAPVYRYNRWIRPMYDKVCGAQMEVLAVMREPVSWLGSWYRYRQRPFMDGRPNSTRGISFEDFVDGYTRGQKPAFADVGSQAKFLERQPNGTGVDHLFRYEDQDRLAAFLSDRLGHAIERPGIANASPEAAMELSAQMRAKLERKCAAEFELYQSIPT